MDISRNSPIPLYYQLKGILREEIIKRRSPPGTRLPSENELIERFQVSRNTVRNALRDLVSEGLIYRERGLGSFVRGHNIVQELTALTGFVEDMVALGYRPTAEVLKTEVVPANAIVASKLNLSLGENVTYIERVRIANDVPLSLDRTWLPYDVGQKVIGEDLRIYPIYSLLEDKFDIPLGDADYVINAVVANEPVSTVLKIPEGSPVFRIERIAYTTDDIPIDYELLCYRADRISFRMRLGRKRPPWTIDRLKDIVTPDV